MPRLLSDLLDLPERVHRGDFVLNLAGGVKEPEKTAASYVVTPQLERAFREALGFIQSAIDSRASKATYLHGSFGSGKSHFMAILYLLLENHPAVTGMRELAGVSAETPWRLEKKCLLIPYHMIGARDMESAILGGYVDSVRKLHPDAPVPGVYRAEGLFRDARKHRRNYGDEKFFELLNQSSAEEGGWGEVDRGWDPASFERAIAAPPGSDERARLIGDLVKHMFPSYQGVVHGKGEAFVPLDQGLSILSRHAQGLGYDALILFLDELILWLASHAANVSFVHQEGQKLAKLVESQTSDRPVPIVSFVARQRDLRELVGRSAPGAEQLGFDDALKHWEGRFHKITLEDRNLPVIAEKRLLRPKDDAARAELDQAFRETEKVREEVMEILLTREADRKMFRQVYPFSPALVQSLVAVSSALQRERTALKIMLQMLVEKRDTLEVGEVVPVGDLWDQVSQGEEAFTESLHRQFELARRLWHRKLRPMLEKEHEVNLEHDLERAEADLDVRARLERFEKDARILKTLLLAAIAPEAEALKNLTPTRLAALNHGSIKTPIPGMEGQIVLDRIKRWGVGELRISSDAQNPTISVQLSEVDVDSVIESAKIQDNAPNRQRKLRDMLFDAMGIRDTDKIFLDHDFTWRGTRRHCWISFHNVRDAALSSFENEDADWKLVIDFPFDAPGYTPGDDLARLEEFRQPGRTGRTLVWIPEFFSRETQGKLGRLVIIDYLLRGDNLAQHTKHLSLQDRTTAEKLLENQQNMLSGELLMALEGAYGVRDVTPGILDPSFDLARDRFQCLLSGFQPQPVVAPDLARALDAFLGQALAWQYPAHPEFGREVKKSELKKVLEVALAASRDPNRRARVEDRKLRPILIQIAEPLDLGRAREDIFLLGVDWRDRFARQLAASGQTAPSVRDLRRWTDEPKPRGLPRIVQDLLILVYAAETQQSFYLHGAPVDEVGIGDLHDDLELRPFRGPPEDVWEKALEIGGHVFGVIDSKILDPENLARFAAKVRKEVGEHGRPARELPGLIRDRLGSLGVAEGEAGEAPRYRTAGAVAEVVDRAADGHPTDLVRVVADARVETSAPAMGTSLKSAASVAEVLRGADWDIFRAIGRLQGEQQTEAREILADLRDVLAADEYAQPLVGKLKVCRSRALALLTRNVPAASPGTPPVPPLPKKKNVVTVGEDRKDGLDADAVEDVSRELLRKLRDDRRLRLDLTWRLYREEGES